MSNYITKQMTESSKKSAHEADKPHSRVIKQNPKQNTGNNCEQNGVCICPTAISKSRSMSGSDENPTAKMSVAIELKSFKFNRKKIGDKIRKVNQA